MAKPKPAPLPSGTEVGAYRVSRVLASGGSSVVYQALTADGQAVLLKEFLPAALVHRVPGDFIPLVRPGSLERLQRGARGFIDGARSLARLQDPQLSMLLDCVQAYETVYLVLRYLEGRTLQDYIVAARGRRGGRCLSESSVISIGLDLLGALTRVHDARLLHLDVKPSNVLITLQGGLVLLDFDAVQPMPGAQEPRPRGVPAHTPGFSAPETLANPDSHGPWTDLYAVGACLYATMVGHPPPHCISRAQDDPVPRMLGSLRGRYGSPLLEAVHAALSLPIGPRPASTGAMADALLRAAQSRSRADATSDPT